MAWPESLTSTQQAAIQNYVDQVFRPAALKLAQAMLLSSATVIPQYLSSPTNLTSTIASPAADSVAGLLAAMTGADVIPILNSGYPLINALTVSDVITFTAGLNSLLGTNWTAAAQQALAGIVGTPNLISH